MPYTHFLPYLLIVAYLIVGGFLGVLMADGSEERVGVFWMTTLFWPIGLPFIALWAVAEATSWLLDRLGVREVHGDTHGV